MVPQTDIRFILCLIISSLVPRSVFVEMLRPNRPEQAQFGLHIPHHVTSSHVNSHIPHQPSELLKKLALLGKTPNTIQYVSVLHTTLLGF